MVMMLRSLLHFFLQIHVFMESLEEQEDFLGVICNFFNSSEPNLGLFDINFWQEM